MYYCFQFKGMKQSSHNRYINKNQTVSNTDNADSNWYTLKY